MLVCKVHGFGNCPLCSNQGPTKFISLVDPIADTLAVKGREHWTRLYTEVFTESDFEAWEQGIPNYGCSCKADFAKLKQQFPPVFVDGRLTFEWKSCVHNLVNRKLGKPELTIEESRAIWQIQTAPESAPHSVNHQ
jgi:hypothetical protein